MNKQEIIDALQEAGADVDESQNKDVLSAQLKALQEEASKDAETEVTSDTASVVGGSSDDDEANASQEKGESEKEKGSSDEANPSDEVSGRDAHAPLSDYEKAVAEDEQLYKELLAEKIAAGLTQEQAEEVLRKQIENDAQL